jgi:hypothetical protein
VKALLKPFLLLALGVLGAACNELEGTTSVIKPLVYNIKPGGADRETIAVGSYESDIVRKKKDLIQITLKGAHNKEYEIKFRVPSKLKLPENGSFVLQAAASGQPWDLFGDVHTFTKRSPLYRDWRRCEYSYPERVCFPDGRGDVRCETRWVTRWGNQDIEYYYLDTEKTVKMSFNPNATRTAFDAQFVGVTVWREEVISWQGRCY